MDSLRVLIAERDETVREGLRLLLENGDPPCLVAEAQDCDEMIQGVEQFAPHVVLLDTRLLNQGGPEMIVRLKARRPAVRVIGLALFDEELDSAVAAGADGCLLKGEAIEAMWAAIRRIAGSTQVQSNVSLSSAEGGEMETKENS